MASLKDAAGHQLVWTQPARMQQAFELRLGDDPLGSLEFERGTLAVGVVDDGRWSFKREGFWHPQVTVRIPGSDENVAVFKPRWAGGGTLQLSQGRELRFASANFWHSQWDWLDGGESLAHFKGHAGFLKTEGEVEIESDALRLVETPLLVVLGWYLLILFGRDAAAASAGSTVAVISTV